ncbi:SRPBCC domain-containing protein [uncultured Paludibaculum sp.]|uniref:SRPBCC family protein n=1 Tax=uncultured Paludibaculum sp. TaxID=1765020 RepID=UPI002AAADEC0|nr:SRPBCC domain-containing protein [uncultured Paludibaculum sp.]
MNCSKALICRRVTLDRMPGEQILQKSVTIDAPASAVWASLTTPSLIQQWMWDAPLDITSDWMPGSPLIISGDLHGRPFTNKGTILACDPEHLLRYTQWSTITECTDEPGNYCVLAFHLEEARGQTTVTLTQTNFVSETSFKHYEFYWNTTLFLMKRVIEESAPSPDTM